MPLNKKIDPVYLHEQGLFADDIIMGNYRNKGEWKQGKLLDFVIDQPEGKIYQVKYEGHKRLYWERPERIRALDAKQTKQMKILAGEKKWVIKDVHHEILKFVARFKGEWVNLTELQRHLPAVKIDFKDFGYEKLVHLTLMVVGLEVRRTPQIMLKITADPEAKKQEHALFTNKRGVKIPLPRVLRLKMSGGIDSLPEIKDKEVIDLDGEDTPMGGVSETSTPTAPATFNPMMMKMWGAQMKKKGEGFNGEEWDESWNDEWDNTEMAFQDNMDEDEETVPGVPKCTFLPSLPLNVDPSKFSYITVAMQKPSGPQITW